MNSNKKIIVEYLKESNLNPLIIQYLYQNNNSFFAKIIELLGQDFDMDKQICIQKIKNEKEMFEISQNGFLFYKENILKSNKYLEDSDMLIGMHDLKTEINNNYITVIDGKINIKDLLIQSSKKNNQIVYQGLLTQNFFDTDFNLKQRKEAMWFGRKTMDIPEEDLSVTIEDINEFEFSLRSKDIDNFNNSEWNYILHLKNELSKKDEEPRKKITQLLKLKDILKEININQHLHKNTK